MRKLVFQLTAAMAMTALALTANAQDYSAKLVQAKAFFIGKDLNSKAFGEFCLQSLPTLDDCKLVFKSENAIVYFRHVEELKKEAQGKALAQTSEEQFADLKVESFTTLDIEQKKGNYAGVCRPLLISCSHTLPFTG